MYLVPPRQEGRCAKMNNKHAYLKQGFEPVSGRIQMFWTDPNLEMRSDPISDRVFSRRVDSDPGKTDSDLKLLKGLFTCLSFAQEYGLLKAF